IGVLTMFPVGAVQMGVALKDQRCAEAATQADAYMRWYWRHYVVEPEKQKQGSCNEDMWKALNGGSSTTAQNDDNPSPPVFVDPMGMAPRGWVPGSIAGLSAPNITRVSLSQINSNSAQALRTCTLLDSFTYNQNGIPYDPNNTSPGNSA